MIELSHENFLLFAVKHYENSDLQNVKEFYDDLKRFKYIKRLLKRYEKNGLISERLLMNHIIMLHNVFGPAIIPMLFFKFEEKYWPQIKTFLVFLDYLPDNMIVKPGVIESQIPLDQNIVFKLRKI